MPTLSEHLRETTKPLHDATEAKFESQKIFDKTYTLEDYKKILRLNYLFHLNFEDVAYDAISAETAEAIQLDSRRKMDLLEKDLQSLGMPKIEKTPGISVENEAQAFGIMYVMEGSTLGGNVIMKQLSRNPEFEGTEFNYFGCYADKTGEYWKNFKETLDSKFSEDQYDEVLKGTQKAYEYMMNAE